MKRKPLLLFAFPFLILAILAGERMATFLLGAYPASPTAWWIWLELRPLSTILWQQIDFNLGESMAVDAAILAAASIVCWVACHTRRSAFFFLANHIALIFAGLMVAVGSHSETASTIATFTSPSGFPFSLTVNFTLKGSLLLVLGTAACAYCHVAFLAEARARSEARTVRILALRRDL
ncbi:hypothetical protein [Mesorhizobium sangaii]|uniref:Uncharacterized protein n=1 Tax=Mesorhizobium sangaii TaxID=505389 RepID=A0A841P6N4_9HYPH|nr:hypothetical protein [Mesorhizobium sangaii]MBB6409013.1 hypothetical protein [Mesorhizobium sangaii]